MTLQAFSAIQREKIGKCVATRFVLDRIDPRNHIISRSARRTYDSDNLVGYKFVKLR
ncbi:MAG: hypothetical protein JO061_07570 [Acidobacteriaceae bacterium]|nr:hypothetical protein [Acidobacteriaceae bacterium]